MVLAANKDVANQNNFEPLLAVIEHFAKDATDLATAKLAFTVLIRICSHWGGPDVVEQASPASKRPATSDANRSDVAKASAALPGFNNFMLERFTTVCWALPTNPSFNPRDAQARQVMGEIASLQTTIYSKTGDEFIRYLKEIIFPSLRLEEGAVKDYLGALQSRDVKSFKQYFLVGQTCGNLGTAC